jgi:putative DNA primase/helicase
MNAEQLAKQLGGKRAGNQFKARCPAHDDHDPSLIIFDGDTRVQVRCLVGCSQDSVIAALRGRGLWSNGDENVSRQTTDRNADRHRALALALWDESRDARNTLGEAYLWQRDLELPQDAVSVIRFNPRCPRGSARVPALVVLMRNYLTRQPQAVQRIFLTQKAVKDGTPQMLGPAGGCAMMLTSWHATFWDDLSFCPRLFVVEGCETGLALLRDGYRVVWALGDAGHIRVLPVLFGVGCLVICADNDLPGLSAAEACAMRWNASSHQRAVIRKRPVEGEDFADGQTSAA